MSDETVTSVSEPSGANSGDAGWALAVALDCENLFAPPLRVGLGQAAEVEIGRGARRAISREQGRLRLDLDDQRASQRHLRLLREGDRWVVEDADSKNGTRVNGERVERAVLADGDVIECGGTFLVLRHDLASIRDAEPPAAGPEALRTLSPSLERELSVLRKLARSRVAILVRGDSGTGKELVASAIHALSGRSGPLVCVNCGAVPATLIESELFGTRRGAFSGAEEKRGLVQSAEGGTLFLDEVAELPVAAQAALLRFVQEGEIIPLGSGKRVAVDVRIVAATNQPIEKLIADGRFRRDLHARLRGHEVRLPPLRSRLEDLGHLIAALLQRLEPHGPPRRLSRLAARAMFLHRWPNHVRELEHALRGAIAVAAGAEIQLADLSLIDDRAHTPKLPSERERIASLLAEHRGNLSALARALTTSRSQVKRLLKRHGLVSESFRRR